MYHDTGLTTRPSPAPATSSRGPAAWSEYLRSPRRPLRSPVPEGAPRPDPDTRHTRSLPHTPPGAGLPGTMSALNPHSGQFSR